MTDPTNEAIPHMLEARLTKLVGRPILHVFDLTPVEIEAMLNLAEGPEPEFDPWMQRGTDEYMNALVATGMLWALITPIASDHLARLYVDRVDKNTLTISFPGLRFNYVLTVEQCRPPDDDGEPF